MIGYPQFISKAPDDHWTKSGWTMPAKKPWKPKPTITEIPNQMTIFDVLEEE